MPTSINYMYISGYSIHTYINYSTKYKLTLSVLLPVGASPEGAYIIQAGFDWVYMHAMLML